MAKDWGLRNQLTRAAVSTMSNIAEGYARKSDREFARYLDMARASCVEVHSLLYVTLDVGYIDAQCFARVSSLIDAVQSRIAGMTNYLRQQLRDTKS
jgi:four helix bundle protein